MTLNRTQYIGGSDSAIICGISPYKTRYQLWLEKTERAAIEDLSGLNHIKYGNYFEPGVADWFSAESGLKVTTDEQFIIHPKYDFLAGNVDRRIVGENAILECKTAFSDAEWGSGQNIIPPHYLMQVAHYCAVGGFDRAYIAVVFSMKREMRWYVYDRNERLEEKLIKREIDFWNDNVCKDVAPEPLTSDDIKSLYKTANCNPVTAKSDVQDKVFQLKCLKDEIKQKEAQEKALLQELHLLMQDHDTLINEQGMLLATWKFSKPITSFNKEKFEKENPELYKKYLVKNDPKRTFLIKVKGATDD